MALSRFLYIQRNIKSFFDEVNYINIVFSDFYYSAGFFSHEFSLGAGEFRIWLYLFAFNGCFND